VGEPRDRASDIYATSVKAQALGWEVVCARLSGPVIQTLSGERQHLMQWARTLASTTTKEVSLRGRDGQPKRTAKLQVAWGACEIQSPHEGKERFGQGLARERGAVLEASPPAGAEGLEWILVTSLVVCSAAEALTIIAWYECRG